MAPVAVGVDTLTEWSLGPCGWRPADRWLRTKYTEVRNSVASPNSLFGAMGLNGMAFLIRLRDVQPSICVTETHPKILHWQRTGSRYNFVENRIEMNAVLCDWVGCSATTVSEHEWDAAVSALAAFQGFSGKWKKDLHALDVSAHERELVVRPCGTTNYWWPEE